jgi:Arc/MetJ family transcription regulator
MVTARMGDRLLAAAKQRTGITSDSELVEIAVANLAVGDDFGEWLLAQRGRLPKDFKLDS